VAKKKVLIITYYWPPAGGVACQRWVKFTLHLKEMGWDPIVYIPENPEYPFLDQTFQKEVEGIPVLKKKIIEPFKILKFAGQKNSKIHAAGKVNAKKGIFSRLLFWIRGNIFIPDARMLWIKPSVKFLKNYVVKNKIPLVIATGPPNSCFLIAHELKKKTGVKTFLDFRDYWFFMDNPEDFHFSKSTLKRLNAIKNDLTQNADAMATVSYHLMNDYGVEEDDFHQVITNGYDQKEIPQFNFSENLWPSKFVLGHFGTFGSDRNFEILWEALSELKSEIPGFSDYFGIKLFGHTDSGVLNSIAHNNLHSDLDYREFENHETVLKEMRNCAILYLPINNNHSSLGRVTSKIFEYLAVRRPILGIGPVLGDAAKIISNCQAGIMAEPHEKNKIKEFLKTNFYLFKNGELWISNDNIYKYERKNLAIQLDKLLTNLLIN
jgi:glycosyltransferase involved in cell wall biosynthesis